MIVTSESRTDTWQREEMTMEGDGKFRKRKRNSKQDLRKK